jgi:signal transduction histidine kinase
MTLRARLALSLVLIAVVLLVPLLMARNAMQQQHEELSALREGEFAASLALGNLRDAMGDVRARQIALEVVKSDTVRTQLVTALAHARTFSANLNRYLHNAATTRIASDLAEVSAAADSEYIALTKSDTALSDRLQRGILDLLRDTDEAVVIAEKQLRAQTRGRVDRAETSLIKAEGVSLGALVMALVLAGIIAVWLTRSVSGPVYALERGMEAVADGDLSHKLPIDKARGDEFGRLATSFEEMTRQLRELDKLKAEFVSIASHELKTPINVILGYLSLLEEGVYGPSSEKQAGVLKTIEAQARTLARLASQLLDVSRFEAGGGRIEPRPIRLPSMLDDLERTFHVLAVQRGVEFIVKRLEPLPEEVQWDPERINEVTGNLLSNAFKFTKAGERVELIAGPHENGVCIQVRDTGAGIPPEQLKHVFEKFYQADNQKSASAKGSGLGLAIAKEIVEAHQGRITCESSLGQGTTFTIILPLRVLDRRRSSGFKLVAAKKRVSGSSAQL